METPMMDINTDPAPWPTWLINWMDLDQKVEPDSSAGSPDLVTGQARMDLPNMDMTPRSALRLVTKTCGLFNSDLTGVDLGSEISPVPDDIIAGECLESLDLISLLDGHSSLVSDQSNVGNLKDSVNLIDGDRLLESLSSYDDLLSLPDSSFGPETDYFEVYTDLSAQIAEEYVTEQEKMDVDSSDASLPVPTPPLSASSIKSTSKATARGRATLKRKAKEPLAETVSCLNSSDDERANGFETIETEVITGDVIPGGCVNEMDVALANVNNDHDYTLKAKRPCLKASEEVTSTKSALPKPSTKEEKYIERRIKNNIASRRSRKTRKDKIVNMEERAIFLAQENVALEEKISKMEALAKAMKEALIKRMATK